MASSLTICGLDSCGDSWIDMMRNARWAAASASFNNRTNISTDLPDTSYQKKGPRRGAPGRGRTWVGFCRGDDRRGARPFTGRAKKQAALTDKNHTLPQKKN